MCIRGWAHLVRMGLLLRWRAMAIWTLMRWGVMDWRLLWVLWVLRWRTVGAGCVVMWRLHWSVYHDRLSVGQISLESFLGSPCCLRSYVLSMVEARRLIPI